MTGYARSVQVLLNPGALYHCIACLFPFRDVCKYMSMWALRAGACLDVFHPTDPIFQWKSSMEGGVGAFFVARCSPTMLEGVF